MSFDFVQDLFVRLTQFAAGLDSREQVAVLLVFGAIPFIESYFGSFIGTIVGIDPLIAVPAAVAGNIVCTFLLIALMGRTRNAAMRGREGRPMSKGKQRVTRYLQRFGVPGTIILAAPFLPSQVTSPTLAALGARKGTVYLWTGIAITLWGILFGFFGVQIVEWLA